MSVAVPEDKMPAVRFWAELYHKAPPEDPADDPAPSVVDAVEEEPEGDDTADDVGEDDAMPSVSEIAGPTYQQQPQQTTSAAPADNHHTFAVPAPPRRMMIQQHHPTPDNASVFSLNTATLMPHPDPAAIATTTTTTAVQPHVPAIDPVFYQMMTSSERELWLNLQLIPKMPGEKQDQWMDAICKRHTDHMDHLDKELKLRVQKEEQERLDRLQREEQERQARLQREEREREERLQRQREEREEQEREAARRKQEAKEEAERNAQIQKQQMQITQRQDMLRSHWIFKRGQLGPWLQSMTTTIPCLKQLCNGGGGRRPTVMRDVLQLLQDAAQFLQNELPVDDSRRCTPLFCWLQLYAEGDRRTPAAELRTTLQNMCTTPVATEPEDEEEEGLSNNEEENATATQPPPAKKHKKHTGASKATTTTSATSNQQQLMALPRGVNLVPRPDAPATPGFVDLDSHVHTLNAEPFLTRGIMPQGSHLLPLLRRVGCLSVFNVLRHHVANWDVVLEDVMQRQDDIAKAVRDHKKMPRERSRDLLKVTGMGVSVVRFFPDGPEMRQLLGDLVCQPMVQMKDVHIMRRCLISERLRPDTCLFRKDALDVLSTRHFLVHDLYDDFVAEAVVVPHERSPHNGPELMRRALVPNPWVVLASTYESTHKYSLVWRWGLGTIICRDQDAESGHGDAWLNDDNPDGLPLLPREYCNLPQQARTVLLLLRTAERDLREKHRQAETMFGAPNLFFQPAEVVTRKLHELRASTDPASRLALMLDVRAMEGELLDNETARHTLDFLQGRAMVRNVDWVDVLPSSEDQQPSS